jgi:hypothetical protein
MQPALLTPEFAVKMRKVLLIMLNEEQTNLWMYKTG